jgi:DeoR/GlpR family transcriptional regulator of sugar metabolism
VTREARLRDIREFVLRDGSVRVRALSEHLRLSEETVRRDLDELASLGLVRRTHGGAAAPGSSLTEFPYQVRQQANRREKRAIARAAVDTIVERGTAVALDSGSTTLEIARALRGAGVTVVTNSLPVISELVGSDCSVVVVGGVARARSLSLIGPLAHRAAAEFHCDVAFVSAPAITAETGPMDTDLEEIEAKQALLRNAVRRYVAVDHTKFGRTAFSRICDLADLTGIVTDDGAGTAVLQPFREQGLDVVVGRRGEEVAGTA